MSLGFHRELRTDEKLTNIKKFKGKNQVVFSLLCDSALAKHQENAFFGLDHLLTVQSKSDNHLSSHVAGLDAENDVIAENMIIYGIYHIVFQLLLSKN